MTFQIPKLSLVVLVGVSGSGKSTLALKHFKPTEVVSSDYCRGLVSDDENDQAATNDAFDVLHYIAGKRLSRGLLTVVDATNVGGRCTAVPLPSCRLCSYAARRAETLRSGRRETGSATNGTRRW